MSSKNQNTMPVISQLTLVLKDIDDETPEFCQMHFGSWMTVSMFVR
jgi:hypothetical protein